MATFRNLPRDVVGRGIVPHMNARTAARFAVASKEYGADARGRANVRAIGAVRAHIDGIARRVAGTLLVVAKHIQTGRWERVGVAFPRKITLPALGRLAIYARDAKTIDVYAPYISAEIAVGRAKGALRLARPTMTFGWRMMEHGKAARRWLVTRILDRAVQMYNEKPLDI